MDNDDSLTGLLADSNNTSESSVLPDLLSLDLSSLKLSLNSDGLDLESELLSSRTSNSVDLGSELGNSNLGVESSLLSSQNTDSGVELLASARGLNTLNNNDSAGLGASSGESSLGNSESGSGESGLSSNGALDDSAVLLDSSLNLAATTFLLVNDDVSVSLSAVSSSTTPLSESLLSSSELELLLLDSQSVLSSSNLSRLDSPSSDLRSSATALSRNGVDSDLDDLAGSGASSDSALEDELSSLDLDGSLVSLDLSDNLSSSATTAALSSDDDLLGVLADSTSSGPSFVSQLGDLSFSSGRTSSDLEDILSLLLDSESPLGNSSLAA